MFSYDDITDEELVLELKKIEEEPSDKVDNSDCCDDIQSDAFQLYMSEIKRYPLLTSEEELQYGKDLKYGDTLSIVDKNIDKEISIYTLNKSKVLCYLANSSIYKTTLDLLLSNLKKINNKNDVEIIKILEKYKDLCTCKKRNLTMAEVEEYFNVDKRIINTYSELEFLDEVKKFFLYRNARDKMFHSNLRLVVSIANKHYGMDIMDIVSDGNFGLMKAIDRYDVDLGFKFSTYATWWIEQSIRRSIGNNRNLIRFPAHYINGLMKYKNEVDLLTSTLGREPTNKEIADALDLSLSEVKLYQSRMYKFVSLSQPVGADDSMTVEDLLEDKNKIDDSLEKNSLAMEIRSLLDEMEQSGEITKEARNIIEMLYGFGEHQDCPRTVGQIGKEIGISAEKVKTIQSKTMRKIRRRSKTKNSKYAALKDYLD